MRNDFLTSADGSKKHNALKYLPEPIWRLDFCKDLFCNWTTTDQAAFEYVDGINRLIRPRIVRKTGNNQEVISYDDQNKTKIQYVCTELKRYYYPIGLFGWLKACKVLLLLLVYHNPYDIELVTQWQDSLGLSAADVCKIACKINRLDIFEFYESRLDEIYFQRLGFMRSCFFISCMYGSHDIAFYLAKKIDNQTRYVVDPDYRNKIFNEIMGGDLPDSCKYQPLLILLSFDNVYCYVKSNPTLGFQWTAPFNSSNRRDPKSYWYIILESFFSLMVEKLHGGINYSLNCRIDCLMFIVERRREETNRSKLWQEDERNVLALLDFSDVAEAIKSSPAQFEKVVSAAAGKGWSLVIDWCTRHGSPRCFVRDSSFFSGEKRLITSTNNHDYEDEPVNKEEPGCSLKKLRSI